VTVVALVELLSAVVLFPFAAGRSLPVQGAYEARGHGRVWPVDAVLENPQADCTRELSANPTA
jgi:hypothetical protein